MSSTTCFRCGRITSACQTEAEAEGCPNASPHAGRRLDRNAPDLTSSRDDDFNDDEIYDETTLYPRNVEEDRAAESIAAASDQPL